MSWTSFKLLAIPFFQTSNSSSEISDASFLFHAIASFSLISSSV